MSQNYGGIGTYSLVVDYEVCDELPTNLDCSTAEPLGQSIVSGDLSMVSLSPLTDQNSTCGFDRNDRRLWYRIDNSVFPSGCAKLDFTGEDIGGGYAIVEGMECGSLKCSYQGQSPPGDVVLAFNPSRTYYVVVFQYWRRGGNTADFSLRLSGADCDAVQTCQAAAQIDEVPFVDFPISDTLTLGNEEDETAIAFCDGVPLNATSDTRGYSHFWYSLTGAGGCLSAYARAERSVFLAVYQGNGCMTHSCVARRLNFWGGDGGVTTFFAAQGEEYKILLVSPLGSTQAVVTVTDSDGDCPVYPSHSFCGSAKSIDTLDYTDTMNLADAARYENWIQTGSCYIDGYARTLWYRVKSADLGVATNGTCIQASLENPMGWAELRVFAGGDCNSLRCVGSISYSMGNVNCMFREGDVS